MADVPATMELRFFRNGSRQIMMCKPGVYRSVRVVTKGPNTLAIDLGGIIVWKYVIQEAGTYDIPIHTETGTHRNGVHYRVDLVVASPGYCGSYFDAYFVTTRVCPEITLHYTDPNHLPHEDVVTDEQYTMYLYSLPRLKFSNVIEETNPQIKTFTEAAIYTKFTIDTSSGCVMNLTLAGCPVGKYDIEPGTRTILLDPPIVYDEESAAKTGTFKDFEFRATLSGEVKSFQMFSIPLNVTKDYGNYVQSITKDNI